MPSTIRASSKDRWSTFFGSDPAARKSASGLSSIDNGHSAHQPPRRRSSSLSRLASFLQSTCRSSSPTVLADQDSTAQSIGGRTPSRRLTKSRPPSLTRSPISEFSSSRSAGHPPSSFRMRTDPARMSSSSILDTLGPPQPLFVDEAISRSSSPSAGWRPRSKSRAGSMDDLSRSASRMSLSTPHVPDTRPASPVGQTKRDSSKKRARSSIFSRGKRDKDPDEISLPSAWIAGDPTKTQYDLIPLMRSERLPELWDERGDTFVYLFPRVSDKGPSFRVHSAIFASSTLLTELAHGGSKRHIATLGTQKPHNSSHTLALGSGKFSQQMPADTSSVELGGGTSMDSSRGTSRSIDTSRELPQPMSLYLPLALSIQGVAVPSHAEELSLTQDDLDRLIIVRNLFSFLVGGALVATQRRYNFLSIFLAIARALEDYGFANIDSTSFGEVANASFDCYVDELDLADVRSSCEKIIEGVVLGERMRSVLLYNEAFVHGVGRYDELQRFSKNRAIFHKFSLISRVTRTRLERAYIDLQQRRKTIDLRLKDFDFPSVFIGSGGRPFKDDFVNTRRYVMEYYKTKYGSWPPRANSRKNGLHTNGLNRLVLREIYQDFTQLYDLFVDRTSLTTRAMHSEITEDKEELPDEPIVRRLRSIFDEYDRSMPPVQPPVPFDVPLLPNLVVLKCYGKDPKRDTKLRAGRLKDDDLATILRASYNPNIATNASPFLSSMCRYERKEARRRTIGDIVNLRAGIWTFVYVVIQALPMLVVDAPGVRYSQGVEWFLCQPPRKGLPWSLDTEGGGRGRQSMAWYGIAGGSGVVSLPSDLIEHGVEGIYRRSHCWLVAQTWSAKLTEASPELSTAHLSHERHDTRHSEKDPANENELGSSAGALPPQKTTPQMRQHPPVSGVAIGATSSSASISAGSSSSSNQRGRTPAGRTHKERVRGSAIEFGLAQLPLPHDAVSPIAYTVPQIPSFDSPKHSTTAVIRNTGMTFDDIIAGINKDKLQSKKQRSSA